MDIKSIYYKIRPMAKLDSCKNRTANKIIIGCFLIMVLCLTVFLTFCWFMFGDFSSFKTRLDKYKYLPETAKDITVYTNSNITGMFLCDFAIGEKDFRVFAKQQNWEVEEIKSLEELPTAISWHEKKYNGHRIKDGVIYSNRAANGGGTTVAYDRENGRGYISKSSR